MYIWFFVALVQLVAIVVIFKDQIMLLVVGKHGSEKHEKQQDPKKKETQFDDEFEDGYDNPLQEAPASESEV